MNSWSFLALLVLYSLPAVDGIRTASERGIHHQVNTFERGVDPSSGNAEEDGNSNQGDGGAYGNVHIGIDNQVEALESSDSGGTSEDASEDGSNDTSEDGSSSRSSGDTSEDGSSNQTEDGNSNQCDGGECGNVLIADDDGHSSSGKWSPLQQVMDMVDNAFNTIMMKHALNRRTNQMVAKVREVGGLKGEFNSSKGQVDEFKKEAGEAETGRKKEFNSLKGQVDEFKQEVGEAEDGRKKEFNSLKGQVDELKQEVGEAEDGRKKEFNSPQDQVDEFKKETAEAEHGRKE